MSKYFLLVGHVDHGKTTLGLSILKYFNNENWLDDNEEKERSKTRDFIDVKLDDTLTLIDTPGHKTYIRNMIQAVGKYSQLPCVGVLVVSARANEFKQGLEGGQIKEDLVILKSFDINNLIIFINKIDLLNPEEKEKRILEIEKEILKTVKMYRFESVDIIHGSGKSSIGIGNLVNKIRQTRTTKSNVALVDLNAVDIVKKDRFVAHVKLLQLENILTIGFKCMLHILDTEIECEIIDIRDDKLKKLTVCRQGDTPLLKIKVDKEIEINKNTRIILRKDLYTIGFGTVKLQRHVVTPSQGVSPSASATLKKY